MSKLLEELVRELTPDIPEEAITVKDLTERGISRTIARKTLQDKIDNHGWVKEWYKGKYFYWKSAD